MTESTRAVELTERQIDFVCTSLDYSALKLRGQPLDPTEDRGAALARRRENEDLISSIKQALQ
jgi:hypothetical protein